MSILDSVIKVPVMPTSYRPSDDEVLVLSTGFFGQMEMIHSAWVNWAIEYVDSKLPPAERYVRPTLVEYFEYCMVLQKACKKHLVDKENTQEKTH